VPVYEEMEAELTEMVGAKVVARFKAYIEERERLQQRGVPLPHPAVRTRESSTAAAADSPASPATNGAPAPSPSPSPLTLAADVAPPAADQPAHVPE
jgi:hypothetical protein